MARRKLERLMAGMDTNEVVSLIGPPSRVVSEQCWRYWDYSSPRIVELRFDSRGRFVAWERVQ